MLGSWRRSVATCISAALLAFSVPLSQGQEQDDGHHFKRLPDGTYPFTNQSGTSINQDYFPAPQNNSRLLNLVEKHHMGQKEWEQIAAGEYGRALNDVLYTLERFPNHPTALMMLSIIAKMTDRQVLAVRYFDHAITLYPQYGLTHAQYGKYLVDVGAFDSGVRKLQTAIEKDPKLGKAHGWLAEAYAKNGQMELAVESAKRAREVGYRGRIPGVKTD